MLKSRSCSVFWGGAAPSFPLRRHRVAFLFLLSLLLFLLPALPIASATTSGPVLAVELQGPITPASDDIVAAALQEAEIGGFAAVMLLLDTPGGGLTETYEIQRLIEGTKVPVIS
jgi:membrane-bound serine protease (ClpP class)